MKDAIASLLPVGFPWADRIVYLPETGSTNDDAKLLARRGAPRGTAVIAGRQTGGRGRLGRSFHSPAGKGLYLSLVLRPECSPKELMHLTCAAGLAARDAVQHVCPVDPALKWTNDLVVGTKKLGGILTELGLGNGETVDYAIIGIGINCLHTEADFPSELRDTATSLALLSSDAPSIPQLAATLLTELAHMNELLPQRTAILNRYRSACMTLGREVSLVAPGAPVRHGTAVDIDDNGALIVRFSDGGTEAVQAGEVSVRGLYGYV